MLAAIWGSSASAFARRRTARLQSIQATQSKRDEKCRQAIGFKRNPLARGMNAASLKAV